MVSITRRFWTAVRNRDWGTAVLDVGVVAIGILMALAVDEWRTEQAALEREEEILTNLHEDIVDREQALEAKIELRLNWMISLAEMRGSAFGHPPDRMPTDKECNSLGASHVERWTTEGLAAFDELVASGNVSAVRQSEIRSSALQYLALKNRIDILRERFELRSVNLTARFPELVTIRLEPTNDPNDLDGFVPSLECDLQGMRSNPAFLANLQSNFQGQTAALHTIRFQLLPQLKALHRLIDERLGVDHL